MAFQALWYQTDLPKNIIETIIINKKSQSDIECLLDKNINNII